MAVRLDGEGVFHVCGLELAFGMFPVAVDVGRPDSLHCVLGRG